MLCDYDDQYKDFHARHHNNTGSPDDFDIFSQKKLDEVGLILALGTDIPLSLYVPSPNSGRQWEHQVGKTLRKELVAFLTDDPRYHDVGLALQNTWTGASKSGMVINALMFGRYTHENGTNCTDPPRTPPTRRCICLRHVPHCWFLLLHQLLHLPLLFSSGRI
jgi:hypothetical protein